MFILVSFLSLIDTVIIVLGWMLQHMNIGKYIESFEVNHDNARQNQNKKRERMRKTG